MGGVPVKHHSKGKVGRRRSHLALKPGTVRPCTNCKAPAMPHRICANCGLYRKPVRAKKTTEEAKANPTS